MKTLIVYSSKYGTAKICAEKLSESIDNSTLCSSDSNHVPSLELFDQIVIGTSVYMGRSRKSIRKFIEMYHDDLTEKNVSLFVCSKETKDYAILFSNELASTAIVTGHFGFELHVSRLRGLDKILTKKVNAGLIDASDIDHQAIEVFLKKLPKQG